MPEMRAATRELARQYENALRPVELTISQYTALEAIAATEELTVTGLAKALGMDRTTTTRLLIPLERRSLVKSAPSEADVRARVLFLSRLGDDALAQARPLWSAVDAQIAARIGEHQMAALHGLLGNLRAALARVRTHP